MKTVVLNTPGTVALSHINQASYFGVCKDLLSKRGIVQRQDRLYYATEFGGEENIIPGTPACGFFYKDCLIEELIRTGFMVVQFDTAKEMIDWLGDEFVEVR